MQKVIPKRGRTPLSDRGSGASNQRRPVEVGTLVAWLVVATAAGGQEPVGAAPARIAVTEAHLLATTSQLDLDPYWVVTLQHFSTWRYGSNFFFLDAAGAPDLDLFEEGVGLYLEYAPVVSLPAVLGRRPGAMSPVADVGLTVQLNAGFTADGFPIARTWLEGVVVTWRVPGFVVFDTHLLARQERGYDGTWQVTWAWAAPFAVGRARFLTQGFVDVWRREGGGEGDMVVIAQPQLLVTLLGRPGGSQLQIGVELQPSHDFPNAVVGPGWDVAWSPMLRWVF